MKILRVFKGFLGLLGTWCCANAYGYDPVPFLDRLSFSMQKAMEKTKQVPAAEQARVFREAVLPALEEREHVSRQQADARREQWTGHAGALDTLTPLTKSLEPIGAQEEGLSGEGIPKELEFPGPRRRPAFRRSR